MSNLLQKSTDKMFNSIKDEQISRLEKLCTTTENEFSKSVMDLSTREVSPDSEEGQQLVATGNLIRRFGSKFLNLFKIEFTISFAGVTIFHFVIPKVDSNLTIKNAAK